MAQRTTELARSNQDLEQFAYVASHDLQEPLRMVTGYLQLLARALPRPARREGRQVHRLRRGRGERMSTLIRDLLAYSRRGHARRRPAARRMPARPSTGACETSLGDRAERRRRHPRSAADGPRRPDATGATLPEPVGNAIKFRRRTGRPRSTWPPGRKRSEWLFSVRDNGIGFEQQYEEKIFVIFQRLHTRGKYPGTGIGLAICKRIVERHGGRIWASGEPGQGATFFFTIPTLEAIA